jgi:hypothetical protein
VSAYLLTWNPQVWTWTDQHVRAVRVRRGDLELMLWSTGNTRRIEAGDRLFLLKQGEPPRGIIASGWATARAVELPHFLPERAAAGDTATQVSFQFDALLDLNSEQPLDPAGFSEPELNDVYWKTPASGISIPDRALPVLETYWSRHLVTQRLLGLAAPILGKICTSF